MTVQRTKIAVIGTGYLGRLHARVLTEMPEVEVVGFVEPNDAVAAEVAQSLQLRRFASAEDLAPEVECAVIATPTTHHAAVARKLIDAGCDVMIEKPITATVADAHSIIDRAAAKGKIIQVGHVERYNPAIVAAAPVMTSPRYIEASRLGIFSPRSLDIDVLLDLMIHDLQLVLSFVNSEVVDVHAVGVPVLTTKVDMANVRLEFANGAVATLTASRVSNERVRKFRVFGRTSYVSVDTREQEVKAYRLRDIDGRREILPAEITVAKKEPLRAELEAFVECVRTRTRPLVAGEEGLAALQLALLVGSGIEASLRNWKEV
jgi:predicted dehydrogenase